MRLGIKPAATTLKEGFILPGMFGIEGWAPINHFGKDKGRSMRTEEKKLQRLLKILQEIYEVNIPFNRVLGVQVVSLTMQGADIRFDMQEKLIGNYFKGILHGGVISSVLDLTGGITAAAGMLLKHIDSSTQEQLVERFSKIGTIDLRVDYLRPGKGPHFVSRGSVLRTGNKVAVTRMELTNHKERLVAVGTGTYIVG
jgi:uncharacterized protein (TIGR00369 family)